MFVVDTNILLYAANTTASEHEVCRTLISQWMERSGAWFLTWGVVYEFLRVATHPAVFTRPLDAAQAWKLIDAVLSSPGADILLPTDRHAAVLREVLDEIPTLAGNILHDAETAVLMREHGIRTIYSRDANFGRFAFVERIDPLA